MAVLFADGGFVRVITFLAHTEAAWSFHSRKCRWSYRLDNALLAYVPLLAER